MEYKDDLMVGVDELRSVVIRRSRAQYPPQERRTILITNVIDRLKKNLSDTSIFFPMLTN
jgi:hypothetical protein